MSWEGGDVAKEEPSLTTGMGSSFLRAKVVGDQGGVAKGTTPENECTWLIFEGGVVAKDESPLTTSMDNSFPRVVVLPLPFPQLLCNAPVNFGGL